MGQDIEVIDDICGGCGHRLPRFTFFKVVGPWNTPDEISAGHAGTINVQTCQLCQFSGPYELPWLLCSPATNRLIFVALAPQTIYDRRRHESALATLLAERVGAEHAWNRLPRLYAAHSWHVPEVISTVPKEFTHTLALAEEHRIERLRLAPRKKAEKAVEQVVTACNRYYAEGAGQVEFGHSLLLTSFEGTPAGRTLLLEAVDNAINTTPAALVPILNQMRDSIPHLGRSWNSIRASNAHPLDDELVRRIEALPTLSDYLDPVEQAFEQRTAWRDLMHEVLYSDTPELVVDLGEFYMREVAGFGFTPLDVEIILIFSVCIENGGGRTGDLESLHHLELCQTLLNRLNCAAFPNGELTQGMTLQCLGQALLRFGHVRRAKELYQEAIKLYVGSEHHSALLPAIRALLDLALSTQDQKIVASLLERFPSEIESMDPVYRRGFLEAIGAHVSPFEVTPPSGCSMRTYFLEFVGPGVTEEEAAKTPRKTTFIPLNFDPDKGVPEGAEVDAVIRVPYFEGAWERMAALSELEFSAEAMVARQLNPDGPGVIREIPVIQQRFGWALIRQGDPEWAVFSNCKRFAMWVWAAQTGLSVWMRSELDRAANGLNSMNEGDRYATRLAIGATAAQTAVGSEQSEADRRHFAERAEEMLNSIVTEEDDPYSAPSRLTPAAQIPLRSCRARCLEILSRWEDSEALYKSNIQSGLRLRQHSGAVESRLQIQTILGADAMRYARCVLRGAGTAAGQSRKKEVFGLLELTRSRALLDRILGADLEGDHRRASSGVTLNRSVETAALDPTYIQLTLVQSLAQSSGYWLGAHGSAHGPELVQFPWDALWALYQKLGKGGANGSEDTILAAQLCASIVVKCLGPSIRATTDTVKISAQSYMQLFPWSFCSIALAASGNHADVAEAAWNPLLASIFSYATWEVARAKTARLNRVCLFLNPTGDLPETHSAADWVRDALPEACDVSIREGLAASAYAFLESLDSADLMIFLGHGSRSDTVGEADLVFSLQSLAPSTIAARSTVTRSQRRVAVILCCWGASTSETESITSWESGGLPYELKSVGYDFIIAPLWPISCRCALAFLRGFISAYADSYDVETAFRRAYMATLDIFGLEVVRAEAGCIQLIA
jgi:hypothetical protein